jgi:glutamate dehydrogenase
VTAPVEFVRDYTAGADPDDLAAIGADNVDGAARAHWDLAEQRADDETAVWVGNPSQGRDGWSSPHTVVLVVTDDVPFLVESIVAAIVGRAYDVHLLLHPRWGGVAFVHVEVDRESDPVQLEELRVVLASVLADVRVVVDDWAQMRARALELATSLRADCPCTIDVEDATEAATFLEWLAADNFTFQAYCEYELVTVDGTEALRLVADSRLGLVRRRELSELSPAFAAMSPETRRKVREPWVLTLTKTQSRSTVHRVVPLDYVGIKRFDDAGAVIGEYRFTGLYTSNVYTESTTRIPIVRRKVERVINGSGLDPTGHDGRALANILETYPRDELFRVSAAELGQLVTGILRMGQRRRVRLFASRDEFGRFVSCLVYLPRDRYTTPSRVGIVAALRRAFRGSTVDFTVLVTESLLARLHVIVDTTDPLVVVDLDALEAELGRLARAWVDGLRDALVAARGEEAGLDTFRRFANAFGPSYQEDVAPAAAVGDITVIERLGAEDDLVLRVEADGPAGTVVKLYRTGPPPELSTVMPMLEHLGLVVAEERPYQVAVPGGPACWIDMFRVRTGDGDDPATAPAAEARLADVFLGVWRGDVENDGLNRLALRAALDRRDIVLVRAWCKYLRQGGVRFTETYIVDTIVANPGAARLLVELFHARLDPARSARDPNVVAAELADAIDAVTSLDEDRILRALVAVVQATVRTNAFVEPARAWLAMKLDPSTLAFLPAPRPAHEIWVYSSAMEGVHLRAGDIARGGIRWSDRREDFRTEILGLMKAQTAKNSVIVPVGAKGGFVVKRGDAIDCYRTLIRGMLDVTDTIRAGEVVGPVGVVRADDDDPYLVVAADKGTATFSDTANELSAEYGFWLGDAFASGGSAGYDHKAMGITARGAWVSVRAHFRALGIDADTAPLTAVGIGDMSGDVFGNGLLRSEQIRLVAAFDHRHVFVDPTPDGPRGFAERRRLFELPRSSWADYDAGAISPGGGVWPRTAKSVEVSAAAAEALGIEPGPRPPDELIQAILRAPVDLLWNGGIGTFVKASVETQEMAGDRTNDGIRIDASELRCAVVGEGGNLGLTQRARVEYALAGGRINTDAIDNSAGVDTSDHEVNIKILLEDAIARGVLAREERDSLLAAMADDVAELVLADNEAQANALSIAGVEAAALVGVHARQIERLEAAHHLDRALEALPTPKQLQERHVAGLGLTTPELAVLLAYTKLELEAALVASDVPDDPYLLPRLVAYFPSGLHDRLAALMPEHRLHREILATVVANSLVNRAGISFLSRLSDETGASIPRLARAHVVATDVFGVPAVWSAIDELDLVVPAAVQDAMFLAVRREVERASRRLAQGPLVLDLAPTVERYRDGVARLTESFPRLLVGGSAERLRAEAARLQGAGVPSALAERVALCAWLPAALDVDDLARETGESVDTVGAVYFVLSDALRLDWLRDRIAELPRGDRWQTEARAALRDELHEAHRALAGSVLQATDASAAPTERVARWTAASPLAVARYQQVLTDIEAGAAYDLTTLAVARRALRELGNPD